MKSLLVRSALLGLTASAAMAFASTGASAQTAACTTTFMSGTSTFTQTQQPITDANGNTCCPSQLTGGPNGTSVCPVTTQSSSSMQSQGQRIANATGGASVRSTRAFIDALGDRYEGGGLQNALNPAEPAGAAPLAYAPLDSFEARYPVVKAPPPPPASPYRFFVTSFGGGFSSSGAFAQNGAYYGGLVGADYRVNNNLIVGASVGGSSSNTSLVAASGSTTGVNGAVFAIGVINSFYAQSLTTLSGFTNDTTRVVAGGGAGGATAIERASFGSVEIRTRAEFGKVVDLGDLGGFPKAKITPFVAMEIAQLHLNGHSEANVNGVGNASGMAFVGQDVSDVPAFVGARLEASYNVGNGMVLTPIIRLAYVHQFANSEATAATFLAGGATSFSPNGTLLGRNSAQTKAGFELNVGRGVVVFANFEGLFSTTDQLYGGRGGVRLSF